MALAIVHMKSRKSFSVLAPWTAQEWVDQIESRLVGEIPPLIMLVDEKGTQIITPADQIEFVYLPLQEGENA
jgi:hypothetical protein